MILDPTKYRIRDALGDYNVLFKNNNTCATFIINRCILRQL
ncbi:hypothetical protein LEP1GSC058_1702 [Leptospira fainei serovar Hurstbridge str. BUT 6]|uniref:Uncharacterized protein n=1 Tax=Leptospira fainei serovar Hurstbridge str. BUT 6 TaxID=1193011 RepID=S3V263_9LEPT|nr:hypothetical protein LEP1GSC058_1702 [Leptospira fainei serovar Hurstbridge str. BUT 6]